MGVDEDGGKWGHAGETRAFAADLGLEALRVTVPWRAGESQLTASERAILDKAMSATSGMRVVLSVFGRAEDSPRTKASRTAFCDYAADVLRAYPTVTDVVIWNEPNDSYFWRPQFNSQGKSAAPRAYEALLAECWDTLHSTRPSVNVITSSSPRGGDNPRAFENISHSPGRWYRLLGAAYKASGRRTPIFDTVGHNPYLDSSDERPWTRHTNSSSIGEGDYDTLVRVLKDAFAGTGQPLPGEGAVTIWYTEQGFQTTIDPSKNHLYSGQETDRSALLAWSPSGPSDTKEGLAPDQATQLIDSVRLAYCQPNVSAFFNFELADENGLAGWQSGLLWADWTPKLSYFAFKEVVQEVEAGAVDCAAVLNGQAVPPPNQSPPTSSSGTSSGSTPTYPGAIAIRGFRVASLSAFSATVTWRTTGAPVRTRLGYGLAQSGPTLWADVRTKGLQSEATLSGLSFATPYRLWLTASSGNGGQVQATLDLRTPGLPDSVTASVARNQGVMRLNGQPFFPFIIWGQCPDGPNLAAGMNLFAKNPCGGLQEQLDTLDGRALSAAVAGEEGGIGPGLIGFFYPDEADGLGMTAETLPAPPPGVPTAISFLTLTNHFYSGADAPPNGRGVYPGLIAAADVVGFDLYPLQGWCRPDRLADVYEAQRELVRQAPGKATFQWIEVEQMVCGGGANSVTPDTVRAEAWLAIAGGAHGLGFFPRWPDSIAPAVARVTDDIAKLGPALLSASVSTSSQPASGPIKVDARTYNGALYVIAVNSSYARASVSIGVSGLRNRTLTVLDENRQVGASTNVFSDDFAPLATHIYIAAPQ